MPNGKLERLHQTVQPAADAVSRGARSLARVEPGIAKGVGIVFRAASKVASVVTKGAGATAAVVGNTAKAGGDAVADRGVLGKVAQVAGQVTAGATKILGGVANATGVGLDKLSNAAPQVGAATGGVVAGVANAVAGAVDHVAVRDAEISELANRLKRQSREYATFGEAIHQGMDSASRGEKRSRLLDSLTVGGVSLAAVISGAAIPDAVLQAYLLAYPDLAARESFAHVVHRLDADQLLGFVSAVKGKLFEIDYVSWLNDGRLPQGLHAELARSATQPGWDIAVVDSSGHAVEVLQAKATDSVAYVKEALERYPHIDIVATDEVQRELMLQGLGEHVASGHVSDAQLEDFVNQSVHSATGGMTYHLVPSAAGLALMALFAFSDTAKSWTARARDFGHRAGQGALATAAGGATMIATHTWWLALASAMGSRYLWGAGNAKRARLERLRELLGANELTLKRLRHKAALPRLGFAGYRS